MNIFNFMYILHNIQYKTTTESKVKFSNEQYLCMY